MIKFIRRRLLMMIPVMLGVVLVVFTLMYITPGDPVDAILGDSYTPEAAQQLREELGLNGGYFQRFFNYVRNLLQGNMGISYITRQPVAKQISQTYPVSMTLAFAAVILSVSIGMVLGIISAVKQYSIFDNVAMALAMIGNSMPSFWQGLLLMLFFALHLEWLPVSGWGGISFIILPAITIGTSSAAAVARMTRSSMLEVIRQDYITTARAKGQSEFNITTGHALRNALIPVITTIGMQFGHLLGGAVLTESIFNIPGMGSMMVSAIRARNFPVVQGGVLIIALTFSVINLFVDILYAYIDPRIRSQYK